MTKIIHTKNPSSHDIDFITKQINQETPEYGNASPFGFFIKENRSLMIAGANGFLIFGSIYTDQLWVHPDHRSKGLGSQLMNAVHEYGRQCKCAMATVATMSFQGARVFYEKLGYTVDFERPGYAQHSSCLFLKRPL